VSREKSLAHCLSLHDDRSAPIFQVLSLSLHLHRITEVGPVGPGPGVDGIGRQKKIHQRADELMLLTYVGIFVIELSDAKVFSSGLPGPEPLVYST